MLSLRRLAPLILGVALVGCGDDSTGPGGVDLQVVAQSFESLGRSRVAAGDGSGATASHGAAMALRAGIRPARVRITVDGVTEDYWALAIEHAAIPDLSAQVIESPILTLPIVSRTTVAWRGAPAERVISITTSSDTGTFSWDRYAIAELPPPYPIYLGIAFGVMFERGRIPQFSVAGGARTTRQTIGAECPLPQRFPLMQVVSPITQPVSCHTALFFTRFTMTVQEGPPAGAAAVRARVVSMEGADIPGSIRRAEVTSW